jgi:sugar lactone lactonase YvrE
MRRSLPPAALALLCGTAALAAGCSGASGPAAGIPGALAPSSIAKTTSFASHDGMLVPRELMLPSIQGHIKPGWLSPLAKAAKNVLYVADQPSGAVYIYDQKGSDQAPIGSITDGISGVDGLYVDAHKTLYACNFGGGTVTVYPAGSTSPSETLTGAGSPIDVAVAKTGTVYVANFNEGTNGTVLVYPKGQTTPTSTLVTYGSGAFPEGMTVDSKGDLYVAFNDGTGQVEEFASGSGSGTNLGIHVGYVGGLTMDKSGDLLLVDQNVPAVDVFPPGATSPSQQIEGFKLGFDVAINKKNTDIYVSDGFNPPSVYEISYPAGSVVDTITNSLRGPYGLATSPD